MKDGFNKKGKLLLNVVVGIFALIGAAAIGKSLIQPHLGQDRTGPGQNQGQNYPPYSFYADQDNDGLSNAKEVIFGTDPLKTDTDGDGLPDGQEVQTGLDPLVADGALLAERRTDNLSVRYFLWLQQEKGIKDGLIDPALLTEFFKQASPSATTIEPVTDIGDDRQSSVPLIEYLNRVETLSVPQALRDYDRLAADYEPSQSEALGETLRPIETSLSGLKTLKPPPEAVDHYQKLLTVLTVFKTMISDLAQSRTDPVLIEANKRKVPALLLLAREADAEFRALQEKAK